MILKTKLNSSSIKSLQWKVSSNQKIEYSIVITKNLFDKKNNLLAMSKKKNKKKKKKKNEDSYLLTAMLIISIKKKLKNISYLKKFHIKLYL